MINRRYQNLVASNKPPETPGAASANIMIIMSQALQRLRTSPIRARIERNPLLSLVLRVSKELIDDDATHLAAGVSFYTLFSLVPLLLLSLSIAGVFLTSEFQQENLLELFNRNMPGSSELIASVVQDETGFNAEFGTLGFIGLIWLSSSTFGSVSHAVNRAWDVHDDRPIYLSKPMHILMAVTVCALMLISVIASSAIELIQEQNYITSFNDYRQSQLELELPINISKMVLLVFPWSITFLLFLLIYRYVPNCKTYWKYIWSGAIVATILFESGKYLFLWYLVNFATYDQIYGPLSSVIVLMSWIYFSAFVTILGAEVSSEYGRMRSKLPRGSEV